MRLFCHPPVQPQLAKSRCFCLSLSENQTSFSKHHTHSCTQWLFTAINYHWCAIYNAAIINSFIQPITELKTPPKESYQETPISQPPGVSLNETRTRHSGPFPPLHNIATTSRSIGGVWGPGVDPFSHVNSWQETRTSGRLPNDSCHIHVASESLRRFAHSPAT